MPWIVNQFGLSIWYHWMWRMGPSIGTFSSTTQSKTSWIPSQQHTLWRRPTRWHIPQWTPYWRSGRIYQWYSIRICSNIQQQNTSLTNKWMPTSIQPYCVSPPIQKRTNPSRRPPITQEYRYRSTSQGRNNLPRLVLRHMRFSNLTPTSQVTWMEPWF